MPTQNANLECGQELPQKRILLVDPQDGVRRVLADVISLVDGWGICGEAGTAREARSALRSDPVDVVILDPAVPDCTPRELVKRFRQEAPEVPILVYSGSRGLAGARTESSVRPPESTRRS